MINTQSSKTSPDSCVEHGIWTAVPVPPPSSIDAFTLKLGDVDPGAHTMIEESGLMTFHLTGCSGDFSIHQPHEALAAAMATQVEEPGAGDGPAVGASFLFHLGDVVYKDEDSIPDPNGENQPQLYNEQFYSPYAHYGRRIFAIPGNHDGKLSPHAHKSALEHFITNFCAKTNRVSPDNQTDRRPAMTQPYVYWRLDTPLAYIIGLYTNVANGGILDDPADGVHTPQYDWLVAQLTDVRKRNASTSSRKAIVLTCHYPPYSGTTNFAQRGDPTLGPTNATNARPLGTVLQQAFRESGQRPDAIFSAHIHLYQRLTYAYADGYEIPCIIAGSGGHSPVEYMWKACNGVIGQPKTVPFDATAIPGLATPSGDRVQIVQFNEQSFGFMRVTIASGHLTGEFFTAYPGPLTLVDSFTLDLGSHKIGT